MGGLNSFAHNKSYILFVWVIRNDVKISSWIGIFCILYATKIIHISHIFATLLNYFTLVLVHVLLFFALRLKFNAWNLTPMMIYLSTENGIITFEYTHSHVVNVNKFMSVLDIPSPALSMDHIAVTFFTEMKMICIECISRWINKTIQIDEKRNKKTHAIPMTNTIRRLFVDFFFIWIKFIYIIKNINNSRQKISTVFFILD